jgi:hypothetical protein
VTHALLDGEVVTVVLVGLTGEAEPLPGQLVLVDRAPPATGQVALELGGQSLLEAEAAFQVS